MIVDAHCEITGVSNRKPNTMRVQRTRSTSDSVCLVQPKSYKNDFRYQFSVYEGKNDQGAKSINIKKLAFTLILVVIIVNALLIIKMNSDEENVEISSPFPTSNQKESYNGDGRKYFYFLENETNHLDCSLFANVGENSVGSYVNNGRMRLYQDRLLKLEMDCDNIKKRVVGLNNKYRYRSIERPIAFVRNVNMLYELQEAFLSISYHPDSLFCYAMDNKSSEVFRNKMRKMSSCFENVHTLDNEFDFDSSGHYQEKAHIECLKLIMDKKWDHAITLQNDDIVIKSTEQLSDLSELLGSVSLMGIEMAFPERFNKSFDWSPSGLQLFKNESEVPPKILYKPLSIRKSLNEMIMSKVFLKSIFEKLNLNIILDHFDQRNLHGVDEMLFPTLYENYLGLEGQMESNCSIKQEDIVSRLTHWRVYDHDGYTEECKSKFKRHGICLLGVEHLKELKDSKYVVANKIMSSFDFGTVICIREMIKHGKTGDIPDSNYLSVFPQFREMQLKSDGKYDRRTFEC